MPCKHKLCFLFLWWCPRSCGQDSRSFETSPREFIFKDWVQLPKLFLNYLQVSNSILHQSSDSVCNYWYWKWWDYKGLLPPSKVKTIEFHTHMGVISMFWFLIILWHNIPNATDIPKMTQGWESHKCLNDLKCTSSGKRLYTVICFTLQVQFPAISFRNFYFCLLVLYLFTYFCSNDEQCCLSLSKKTQSDCLVEGRELSTAPCTIFTL